MLPSQFASVGALRSGARDIAEEVLATYWPEGTFPIDPVVLARRLSLEVYSAELGDDVFGMLVGDEGNSAVIYVDRDQPEKRMRFTVAHEIGHFLDRNARIDDDVAFVDRRSDEDRGAPDEVWANEVAGNLLMPVERVRTLLEEGKSELEMATYFGVSLPALRYRRQVLSL